MIIKFSRFIHSMGITPGHKILLVLSLTIAGVFQCKSGEEKNGQGEESITIQIKNPLDFSRQNVPVLISQDKLDNSGNFNFSVYDGEKEIQSQYISKGSKSGLFIVLDSIGSLETKVLTVRAAEGNTQNNFKKRTQAEISVKKGGEFKDRKYIGGSFENIDSLRVPDEHTDHSFYIRYEGPGWESDKVGYRFYLDWRNATDVFGKTTEEMVLHNVGQDGFDSYHEMQDWGMDILKVGNSLGIGSPAVFYENKVVRIDSTDSVISKVLVNGDIFSAIQTNYYGWKVSDQALDIQSIYSIHAGSRLTHHTMEVSGMTENISTGIGKSDAAQLSTYKGDNSSWGYIATYGQQSLNNDNVGLAVFFQPNRLAELTEDEHSHIVKLNPDNGKVEYYFLAAWELEPEGIKNELAFLDYVKKTARELAKPVVIVRL